MTKISFNRLSDWVRARKAREMRHMGKSQSEKAPIGMGRKRHTSPDPDLQRISLKITQSRLAKQSKAKPSMPRMPWEDDNGK